jgi:excisionase family DNA binding protein
MRPTSSPCDRTVTARLGRKEMSQVKNHSSSAIIGTGFLTETTAIEAEAVAFYTVAQLAVRWSICERQVHRYINSGELIATRFGRSVRISAAEAARFEASRTVFK